jgi:hypothetical protein
VKKRLTHSIRPRVEALESRLVMSVTEYSEVAQMFARHEGPTNLYLNFDGYQAENVLPFAVIKSDKDPTTDDREIAIQEILFRTSEIFSPFDVQVRRAYGDGAHVQSGGHTTVFVGDDLDNGTGMDNQQRAYAMGIDGPCKARGVSHRPNSDPYNVAFVDPVYSDYFGVQLNPSQEIARTIAHEAGHTFGLGHVLNPEGQPDLMSYDSYVMKTSFVDEALSLTNRNGPADGDQPTDDRIVPQWFILTSQSGPIPYNLQTQNSFRFLEATLGTRPADDYGSIISSLSVDSVDDGGNVEIDTAPHYLPSAQGTAPVTTSRFGVIERYGDYDVFKYSNLREGEILTIEVKSGAYLGLDSPMILAYSQGETYYRSIRVGEGTIRLTVELPKFNSVVFVVGGLDGNTVGSYELTVTSTLRDPVVDNVTENVGGTQVPSNTGLDPEPPTGGVVVNPGLLGTVGTWTVIEPGPYVGQTWLGATYGETRATNGGDTTAGGNTGSVTQARLDTTYGEVAGLAEEPEEELVSRKVWSRWSPDELNDSESLLWL